MRFLDGKALVHALGISTTIFLAVVAFLIGLDDFLTNVFFLDGGHWQTWMDICSNLLFMFVVVSVVLYAVNVIKKD